MSGEKSVLEEAQEIIHGQRREDYGSPLESFERIAKLWSVVLEKQISPEDVALCMIQLKVARAMNGMQRDSLVDIAGYAGCIEMVQDEQQARLVETMAAVEKLSQVLPEPRSVRDWASESIQMDTQ